MYVNQMCTSHVFIYKHVWIKSKNWYIIAFLFEKRGSTCTERKNTRLEENQRYEYGRDPKV